MFRQHKHTTVKFKNLRFKEMKCFTAVLLIIHTMCFTFCTYLNVIISSHLVFKIIMFWLTGCTNCILWLYKNVNKAGQGCAYL